MAATTRKAPGGPLSRPRLTLTLGIMNEPISIRCSSLPILHHCTAALRDDGIRMGGNSPEAELGTAVHAVLAARLYPGPCDLDAEIDAAAKMYGCDPDELGILQAMAWQVWEELRTHFHEATAEERMEASAHGVTLSGTADVLDVVPGADGIDVRVLDWKTGYLDLDHLDQLRGYAWLAMQATPDASSAWVVVVRVRDRSYEGVSFTRSELEEWFEDLSKRLHGQEQFNPGQHCQYCPRAATCPAKEALLRQSWAAIRGDDYSIPIDSRADWLAGMLQAVKFAEIQAELIRGVIRAEVVNAGGSMTTSDGRELVIRREERKEIDTELAWPILSPILRGDMLSVATIGKGKLEKAIKATVPKGKGAGAIRDTMERLSQAGAIHTTYVEKLEIRRNGSNSSNATGKRLVGSGAQTSLAEFGDRQSGLDPE